jgi:zinc D-Ala-D-Ala carboxypeptidase
MAARLSRTFGDSESFTGAKVVCYLRALMSRLLFVVFAFLFSAANPPAPKDDLLGKFDPAKHPEFTRIEKEFTAKENIYLRKEAYRAYKTMYYEALKCGIKLIIISATRSFEHQKNIWEKKWNSPDYASYRGADRCLRIMRYSSMPGTSRHHWGTDIDINSLEPAHFAKGEGKKTYEWLVAFAPDYGFKQTYTSKAGGRTGYEEEHWHWSYFPIADSLQSLYNAIITYDDIRGFAGSEFAREVRAIEDFVNGVE